MDKNKLLFLLLLFVMGVKLAHSQAVDDNLVKLADEMYGFGDKKDALGVYLQALEINPDNVIANYMAGKCYLETLEKGASVDYFLKAYALKKDVSPDILFKIASGYHLSAKFDEAIAFYRKYKEELTDAQVSAMKSSFKDEVIKTERRISECQNAKIYYKNPINYKIENIKDIVNSEYPDYAPAITADQSFMVFTSRRSGGVGKNKDFDNEYFEDVWYTVKENGEWIAPKNIGSPINTNSHDASIGFSQDGKTLFLYKPDNAGDIYFSNRLPDGKWSKPTNIGPPINSRFKELSISISADGKSVYFSSDRAGGFGNFDIYKSDLHPNGKWGKPQNLGSAINTEYDEDSPYIDADGKTLYFSSRGHKGMGGYDIYKVVYDTKRKTWGEPVNMGFPINSPDDDIYFVITGDGKTGYYASAKTDGFGDKDIYMIDLSKILDTKADTTSKYNPTTTTTSTLTKAETKSTKKDSTVYKQTTPPSNNTVSGIAKKTQAELKKDSTLVKQENQKQITQPDNKPLKDTTQNQSKVKGLPSKQSNEQVATLKTPSQTNAEAISTEKNAKPISSTGVSDSKTNSEKTSAPPKSVAKPTPKSQALLVENISVYPTVIRGNVSDHYTGEPLIATIVVQDMYGNVIKTTHTDEKGDYSIELATSEPTKTNFTVIKDGYIYANINVLVPKDAIQRKYLQRDFTLKKVDLGQVFILRNIYYEFNQSVIKRESHIYLNKLVAWMKANPSIHLEIGGHTDDIGPRDKNLILSQKRVESVKQYLVDNGINRVRLTAIGYGEDRPLATNDDETEGREINRRTEFKIIKK